ncbi:MAG: arsenite efflux transporter metallochaperone ArsD [Gemmatimonadota bacterium]
MVRLQIYEPAMCCSTGLCGPDPDEALVQFSADIRALSAEGVSVQRFNLSQTPHAFVDERIVNEALDREGVQALPVIVREGEIVSKGRYPSREELARMARPSEEMATPEAGASLYTPQVAELVAIGAAIASNCEACFRFHFDQARKLGVSRDDMIRAVNTAQGVKNAPARAMMELAAKYLDPESVPTTGGSCDGGGGNDASCC